MIKKNKLKYSELLKKSMKIIIMIKFSYIKKIKLSDYKIENIFVYKIYKIKELKNYLELIILE